MIGMQVFAQKTITGTVNSADDGSNLPGVSVVVKGTNIATVTDMDGKYTMKNVPDDASALIFSLMGMETQEVAISGDVVDCALNKKDVELTGVVVTALGIKRDEKTLTYAAQDVSADQLNVTNNSNIKDALAGKVAGIQNVGQAGSKLGQSGKLRIRGAISLTSDADPLYVVDGVPVYDPNAIDMSNVADVSVLKGPNATALYGQRAEYGVIMITTKTASAKGISVEISSTGTFDYVSYLPNYQNLYGGGYDGNDEWIEFDSTHWSAINPAWNVMHGERYIFSGYADESWGPAFSDTTTYAPWYSWWPGTADNPNPYYGQTAQWVAQPDNVKDFYNTGVTLKNSVAVSSKGDNYNARLSFTNLNQSGIIPSSNMNKNYINANFSYSPTDKLTFGMNFNYSLGTVNGDFDDSYSNQTTGVFNQWMNRNIDMNIMRELQDLQTTSGYHASWNWWNPIYAAYFGGKAEETGAFWYNPYFWLKHYVNETNTSDLVGNINFEYKITDYLSITASAATNVHDYSRHYELPFIISNSADLSHYNTWNNGFGNYINKRIENNYTGRINFNKKFGDFDVDAFVGGNYRVNSYTRMSADMDIDSKTQNLVIPDVFTYSNAVLPVTAATYNWNKKVVSAYTRASIGWRSTAYLDLTYRQDWSSALPTTKNGYGYPSVGFSFIFTELLPKNDILSFGKIRSGWAQVGTDLAALAINPVYPLSASPYNGMPQMYTNSQLVDPNIEPALNTSLEAGIDLKFMSNRIGVSFTYFNEVREKEIIPIALTYSTGYATYLTNAGKSQRSGIELQVSATPVKMDNFQWDISFNFATSNPVVLELPGDLQSMAAPGGTDDWGNVTMTHSLGEKWGQLRGSGIATDSVTGVQIVNATTGLFEVEQGMDLGSVIPDYTGGIFNSFTIFKLVNISATIDFQKGGKFFSQSEWWGNATGVMAETAELNDLGNNVRDDLVYDDADASGTYDFGETIDPTSGGVHVTGVDENGDPFDGYVDAYSYYTQFQANSIASPFVHNADYVKLRDVSVSVNLPQKWLGSTFIKGVNVGFVGRNLWMISVAKDNVHNWDPSEMSMTYGENAGLPGIKSYGFNIKLTF